MEATAMTEGEMIKGHSAVEMKVGTSVRAL